MRDKFGDEIPPERVSQAQDLFYEIMRTCENLALVSNVWAPRFLGNIINQRTSIPRGTTNQRRMFDAMFIASGVADRYVWDQEVATPIDRLMFRLEMDLNSLAAMVPERYRRGWDGRADNDRETATDMNQMVGVLYSYGGYPEERL